MLTHPTDLEAVRRAPSLAELLTSGWHDRRILAATFLAIASVALALSLSLLPTYQAKATLVILPSPEYMVRPEAGTRSYAAASLSLDQLMTAETGILDSPSLHVAVIRRIGLARLYPAVARQAESSAGGGVTRPSLSADDKAMTGKVGERAIRRFEASLSVTASKEANLITVKFSHPKRFVAAAVVNALLQLYAQERRDLYADPQTKIVASDVETLRQRAANAEDTLALYMTRNNLADFSVQRDLLLKREDTLTSVADANRQEVEQLSARATALTQALVEQPRVANIYIERDTDQRVADLDKGIADSNAKLKVGEIDFQPQSRRLTRLHMDVASRQAARTAALRDLGASLERSGPSPLREGLVSDLAHVRLDLAGAEATQSTLRQQLTELERRLHLLLTSGEALDRLQQQKAITEDGYAQAKRILADRELTEAEDQWRLARVRVIQEARVPQFERPWRALIAIAGVFVGLVTSMGLGLYLCATRATFVSANAVERLLGIPVLAEFLLPRDDGEFAIMPR